MVVQRLRADTRDSHADSHTYPEPDTHAYGDSHSDCNTHTHAYSHPYSDTDSNSYAYTHSDCNTYTRCTDHI